MSEASDRDKRPGSGPDGQRRGPSGPAKGAPKGSYGPGGARSGGGHSGGPARSGGSARSQGGRRADEQRVWTRDGKPARGDSSSRDREEFVDPDPFGTRSVRPRHDDPDVADDVKASDLDRVARAQLKTLTKENAEFVAEHLVMAARLIDTDPELAHRHSTSAARRAGRIAVVRETLAITAYAIGDYALALRELRTYRRISGRDDQLPMMVDSERGLERPDRALELGRSVPRATLPVEVQVELAIAMSGARLDLGDTAAAQAELEIPQLDPDRAFSWSPALFSAYAAVLEDSGQDASAAEWYDRADRAAAALERAASGDEDEDYIEIFEVEETLDGEAEDAGTDSDPAEGGGRSGDESNS